MLLRRKSERGDTIIEVLLAIAVVSSVLGIAYSIMNRNILTLRDNQERTQAAKLAEGQIERLKHVWNTDQASIISQGANAFCINGTTVTDLAGASPTATPETDNFGNYAGGCRFDNFFNVGIRFNNAANSFTVFVRWDRVGGGQRGQVVLVYRVS